DPEGVPRALNRAAQLIAELAGGTVNPGIIDNYPNPVPPPPTLTLSTVRTNSILGTELTSDEISQTLRNLTFTVNEKDKETITVTPPSFRVDIKENIDLVEEVARLWGYDKIPATLPNAISQPPKKDRAELLEKKIKETLVQHGYREIITYSFISPLDLQNLGLSAEDQRLQPLTLLNPLTEDQSAMRTTLLPGLLSTARKNIFQNNSNLKLFEVGPVFFRQENERLPREIKRVAGLATGLYQEESWDSDGRTVDFYDLKGCVETLLNRLRIRNLSFSPPEGSPFLNTVNALDLMVGKQKVGFVGEILPQILDSFQLSQQIYAFEICLSRLLPEFSEQETFRPLPKYPPVYRDIALVIDDTIPAQTVSETMKKFKNKYIEEIEIFDYYKGKSLAPGKKSLAYRLKYQAYDHTLTDREVNALHEKLINNLHQELGAVLRE
ncbi:MAG: phenylalanine--tRNA ligase subunit beta, partial [Thermodesulfobacteriota bacterium]|nr:phenylalanine--tRNA ligase subunit beta [Thermodesulfobacteriota bacterium]